MASAGGTFPRSGLTARSPINTPSRVAQGFMSAAPPQANPPSAQYMGATAASPISDAQRITLLERPESVASNRTNESTRQLLEQAQSRLETQDETIRVLQEQVSRLLDNAALAQAGNTPVVEEAPAVLPASLDNVTFRARRNQTLPVPSVPIPIRAEPPSTNALPQISSLGSEAQSRARRAYGFSDDSYVPPENRRTFVPIAENLSGFQGQGASQQESADAGNASGPGNGRHVQFQSQPTQDSAAPGRSTPLAQPASTQYGDYQTNTPRDTALPLSDRWQGAGRGVNRNPGENSGNLRPAATFQPETPNISIGNQHGPTTHYNTVEPLPNLNTNAPNYPTFQVNNGGYGNPGGPGGPDGSGGPGGGPGGPGGPNGPGGNGPANFRSPNDRSRREQTWDSAGSRSDSNLKVSDIGYWDPRGHKDDKGDEKKNRLVIPVELFVGRLKKLGRQYGEQAVVKKLDAALVNISSWLLSLSPQDELLCQTLDGYIYVLLRDWSEPDVISRQKAKDYSCSDARDSLEFYIEKLAKLCIAGYDREQDQYYEMWVTLPAQWKATIPMQGSLLDMKSALRQRELSTGWPGARKASFGSDSGYDSAATSKRNGASAYSSSRESDASSSSKRTKGNDSKQIPYCMICKGLDKVSHRHWHRDCPNQKAGFEKVNTLKSIKEALDEASTDSNAEKNDSEDDSSSAATSEPEPERGNEHNISRVYCDSIIQAVKSDQYVPSTFPNPQVFDASFDESVKFGKGNVFQGVGPVHVYVRSLPNEKDIRVCADTGCGPSIGNRAVVTQLFPDAKVSKRSSKLPLRVKGGFDGKEYEILPDFVAVDLYLVTTKGNLLRIQVEIHLSDAVIDSSILLGSSCIQSNHLLLDLNKEVLISRKTYQGFKVEVPIYLNEQQPVFDNVAIRCSEDLTIPADHEGLVHVDMSQLPSRTLIFKGRELGKDSERPLVRCADSPVDRTVKRVMVANMSEKPIVIKCGRVVGYVSEMNRDWAESVMAINTLTDMRPWFEDFVQVRH